MWAILCRTQSAPLVICEVGKIINRHGLDIAEKDLVEKLP
jgi:hypothetical protein